MAARYSTEFYSENNVKWTVEIHDTLYGGASADFDTDDNGFTLDYKGNTDDLLEPIIGSEARVTAFVEDSDAFFYVMLLQMVACHEGRFSLKIMRNDALYWAGWIVQDLFTEEDTPNPCPFELSATDGIARLKDIPYDNAGTLYTGDDRVTEHLIKILTKIGLTGFWGADDYFLVTGCNWYEDSHHAPGSTYNPLYLTKIQHEAFQQTDDYGVVTPMSSYDVLQQILKQFNTRIIMSHGQYYVLPVAGYGDATLPYIYVYNKTGVYKAGQTNWNNVVSTFTCLAGGQRSYMPPLLSAFTTYKFKQGTVEGSLLPIPYVYDDDIALGEIQGGGDEQFVFSGDIDVKLTWEDAGTCPELRIKIVYELDLAVDPNYLDNITDEDNVEWVADNTKYYAVKAIMKVPPPATPDKSANIQLHFGFITPEIPASGTGTFDFKFKEFQDMSGNVLDLSAYSYTLVTTCHNFRLNLMVDADELQEGVLKFEATSTTDGATPVDSKSKKDLGETVLGDGPNSYSSGRLMIYTGADWENSDTWSLNQTGSTYDINQLRCREALAIQRLPTWRHNGSLKETGVIYAHNTLSIQATNYMLQSATLTASSDTWSGVWVRI